jgi:hypothetical protein
MLIVKIKKFEKSIKNVTFTFHIAFAPRRLIGAPLLAGNLQKFTNKVGNLEKADVAAVRHKGL